MNADELFGEIVKIPEIGSRRTISVNENLAALLYQNGIAIDRIIEEHNADSILEDIKANFNSLDVWNECNEGFRLAAQSGQSLYETVSGIYGFVSAADAAAEFVRKHGMADRYEIPLAMGTEARAAVDDFVSATEEYYELEPTTLTLSATRALQADLPDFAKEALLGSYLSQAREFVAAAPRFDYSLPQQTPPSMESAGKPKSRAKAGYVNIKFPPSRIEVYDKPDRYGNTTMRVTLPKKVFVGGRDVGGLSAYRPAQKFNIEDVRDGKRTNVGFPADKPIALYKRNDETGRYELAGGCDPVELQSAVAKSAEEWKKISQARSARRQDTGRKRSAEGVYPQAGSVHGTAPYEKPEWEARPCDDRSRETTSSPSRGMVQHEKRR